MFIYEFPLDEYELEENLCFCVFVFVINRLMHEVKSSDGFWNNKFIMYI